MRKLKVFIQLMLGLAILVWLLQLADATKILMTIMKVDLFYIAASTAAFIVASIFVAFALYVALRRIGTRTNVRNALLASFSGQLLSDVTPARFGYFLTPFILNRMDQTSVESSMAGVVATGAANLLVKAVLSAATLAYFMLLFPFEQEILNVLLIGISLLVAAGLALLALLRGRRMPTVFKSLTRIPVIDRALGKFVVTLDNIQAQAEAVSGSFSWIILLIVLSIATNAVALFFIWEALLPGSLSLFHFLMIVPLVSAFNFVPITIAGLGIQETSYVAFLTLFGAPIETAVAFTLINRLLYTATDVLGLPPLLKTGARLSMTESGKTGGPL
jgi:uncharacterized membrane protein YbhN (UPF0104 family)